MQAKAKAEPIRDEAFPEPTAAAPVLPPEQTVPAWLAQQVYDLPHMTADALLPTLLTLL
jgi:hypothetical protein